MQRLLRWRWGAIAPAEGRRGQTVSVSPKHLLYRPGRRRRKARSPLLYARGRWRGIGVEELRENRVLRGWRRCSGLGWSGGGDLGREAGRSRGRATNGESIVLRCLGLSRDYTGRESRVAVQSWRPQSAGSTDGPVRYGSIAASTRLRTLLHSKSSQSAAENGMRALSLDFSRRHKCDRRTSRSFHQRDLPRSTWSKSLRCGR